MGPSVGKAFGAFTGGELLVYPAAHALEPEGVEIAFDVTNVDAGAVEIYEHGAHLVAAWTNEHVVEMQIGVPQARGKREPDHQPDGFRRLRDGDDADTRALEDRREL